MKKQIILFISIGVLMAIGLQSCSCGDQVDPCAVVDISSGLDLPQTAFFHWWDGSDFIYIPPSEFTMGVEAPSGDNTPAHSVSLSAFWIQQTEVTNSMYAGCVEAGMCQAPTGQDDQSYHYGDGAYANHPVGGVTWEDARNYCGWIGGGLPSEAEWELAAGGGTGDPHPWGEAEPTCELANFLGCLDPGDTMLVNSHPDGLSPSGLADMTGNVFEWIHDWYGEDYYTASPTQDPGGPDSGELRVLRGGSYLSGAEDLPVTQRNALAPDTRQPDLGFRCVLAEDVLSAPVMPACQAQPYAPVQQQPPLLAIPAQIEPSFTLDAFCSVDANNNQFGTGEIMLEPGLTINEVGISSPNGAISCTPDQNVPQKLSCSGSAFQPGGNVTVKICLLLPPPPVQGPPTCPVEYDLDPVTDLCTYVGPCEVQCMAPAAYVPGYGCLPPPVNGGCQMGSYAAEYNGQPVCVPVVGDLCECGGCSALCPQGLEFTQEEICCSTPQDVPPLCPFGFSYDTNLDACLSDTSPEPGCSIATVFIPNCPMEACWITTTVRGPSGAMISQTTCVSPCPIGPNGGPCDP